VQLEFSKYLEVIGASILFQVCGKRKRLIEYWTEGYTRKVIEANCMLSQSNWTNFQSMIRSFELLWCGIEACDVDSIQTRRSAQVIGCTQAHWSEFERPKITNEQNCLQKCGFLRGDHNYSKKF
jgi:hypothetical protein